MNQITQNLLKPFKQRTFLGVNLSLFLLLTLSVFALVVWLQYDQLWDPFIGDEILYVFHGFSPASLFELHLPVVKALNTFTYSFFGSIRAMRFLGVLWYALISSSLFFLCKRYFSWTAAALICLATMALPIPYTYATSFENILPGVFFLTLLIHALIERDERKIALFFILGSLAHISSFIFGCALIAFHQMNARPNSKVSKVAISFSALYLGYIAFLLIAKPVFGIEISSMRLARHFDPPRDIETLYQRFKGALFISELFLPMLLGAVVICYASFKKAQKNELVNCASILLICFLFLQVNYNANATKNALYANIILLPAFLSLFKNLSPKKHLLLIILVSLGAHLKIPTTYKAERYRVPSLNIYQGYNRQISKLLKSFSQKCATQVSGNLGLLTEKFYGYQDVNAIVGDQIQSDRKTFIKLYEGVGVNEIKAIPRTISMDEIYFSERKLFHNLTAAATYPLEKNPGLIPELDDSMAYQHQAMALAVYSQAADCLEEN